MEPKWFRTDEEHTRGGHVTHCLQFRRLSAGAVYNMSRHFARVTLENATVMRVSAPPCRRRVWAAVGLG
ncbi:hypothetical protein J6590_061946 [Homalodisca vitripennis]|nr:hypothetical protein J6590_061946 [Homalodisca vitripennis]